MEVKGKIVNILPVESGQSNAGKEWQKQAIVIDNGAQFNPLVCVSFFGDKVKLLEGLKVGQDVSVSINVSSREFNGKWYQNVDGWKVEGVAAQAPAAPQAPPQQAQTAPTQQAPAAAPAPASMPQEDVDDLPF